MIAQLRDTIAQLQANANVDAQDLARKVEGERDDAIACVTVELEEARRQNKRLAQKSENMRQDFTDKDRKRDRLVREMKDRLDEAQEAAERNVRKVSAMSDADADLLRQDLQQERRRAKRLQAANANLEAELGAIGSEFKSSGSASPSRANPRWKAPASAQADLNGLRDELSAKDSELSKCKRDIGILEAKLVAAETAQSFSSLASPMPVHSTDSEHPSFEMLEKVYQLQQDCVLLRQKAEIADGELSLERSLRERTCRLGRACVLCRA